MKRQGLSVSLAELLILQKELIDEATVLNKDLGIEGPIDYKQKWQIGIINKTPRCSDTWELEMGK